MMDVSNTPFEYYNNKLGVKIIFLISDPNKKHNDSISVISYRAIRGRMDSKNCSEKRLRRSSIGHGALILFNSISQEWRDMLTIKFGSPKEENKKSWFAQHYISDKEAFNFYVGYRYGENNKKRLKPEFIEQYVFNASVLNTVIKMKNNRKAYARALGATKVNIWRSLSNDVNAFQDVAHDLPTTPDSLRRKTKAYQLKGYEALISGKLKTRNATKINIKEQKALLDELINKHTNLETTSIATIYNTIAEKMGWESISVSTVANFKETRILETYAGLNGVKALKNNLTMQRRRYAPTSSMLFWTLDGWTVELLYQKRQLKETTVIKDGRKTKRKNEVTTYHHRLTLLLVLDPFNKYPIGYAIGEKETPELIKRALQNAVTHTKELFGSYFIPYQLQSDNYAIKTLTPLYKACTKNFTPASVGNAKAKVIEPYFKHLNEKRCKLFDNWSGHNTITGSKKQPNAEVLGKLKKSFPDEEGCRKQIMQIIELERSQKKERYIKAWLNTKNEYRSMMSRETFLMTFGEVTESNKLRGQGLRVSINGSYFFYECFDIDFRKHSYESWKVHYNPLDINDAIAVSKNGDLRFDLEIASREHMALADRNEYDDEIGDKVKSYNKNLIKYITEERKENAKVVEAFFSKNPELDGTLAKHLLTDSEGQHKIYKTKISEGVSKARKTNIAKELYEDKTISNKAQQEYYENKVDVDKYLED